MARIGTNMNVQIEAVKETALTVSAVTKDSPGVATSTAHGLANGDVVVFAVSAGMVELEGQAVRIANVATDTFELESLDTTDFSTFTAGTAAEISSFHTMSNAQSVSMPDATPNKIDATTLIDTVTQVLFGLPEAPDGTIPGLYAPQNAAVLAVKAATDTNTPLAIKVNWSGGEQTIFNARVSGGSGFELQQNDVAKATVSITPVRKILDYAAP